MSTMAEDVTQILWGKRFPHGGRDEYVLIDANMAHAVAEHVADALTKAGYGKLAEARAAELETAAHAAESMHDPVAPDCLEWAGWLRARAAAIRAGGK